MNKVISYIFSFIFAILIICLSIFLISKNTILNKEYTLDKIEEVKYYEKIENDIIQTFKDYTIQTGLTDEVVNNLFSKEKLKQDINNIINTIYTGETFEIDTTEIIQNLKNNINEEVQKEGKVVDFNDVSMKQYLDAIKESYTSQINYSKSIVEKIGDNFSKINKKINNIEIFLYVIIAVIGIIIILINLKNCIGLNYIGISIMTAGIFNIMLYILFNYNINIKNIMVINQASTNLIQLIIQNLIMSVLVLGIIFVIIGIILCLIYNLIKKDRK